MDLHRTALAARGIVFTDALFFDRGVAPVLPADTDHPRFEEMDNAHFMVLSAAIEWDAEAERDYCAEQLAFWRAVDARRIARNLAEEVAQAEARFRMAAE